MASRSRSSAERRLLPRPARPPRQYHATTPTPQLVAARRPAAWGPGSNGSAQVVRWRPLGNPPRVQRWPRFARQAPGMTALQAGDAGAEIGLGGVVTFTTDENLCGA
jgi:hypothetical protein